VSRDLDDPDIFCGRCVDARQTVQRVIRPNSISLNPNSFAFRRPDSINMYSASVSRRSWFRRAAVGSRARQPALPCPRRLLGRSLWTCGLRRAATCARLVDDAKPPSSTRARKPTNNFDVGSHHRHEVIRNSARRTDELACALCRRIGMRPSVPSWRGIPGVFRSEGRRGRRAGAIAIFFKNRAGCGVRLRR
jgi:hypothetical protein